MWRQSSICVFVMRVCKKDYSKVFQSTQNQKPVSYRLQWRSVRDISSVIINLRNFKQNKSFMIKISSGTRVFNYKISPNYQNWFMITFLLAFWLRNNSNRDTNPISYRIAKIVNDLHCS